MSIDLPPSRYRVRVGRRWKALDDWRWNLGGFVWALLLVAYVASRANEVDNKYLLVGVVAGIGIAAGLLLSVVLRRLEQWLDS